MLARVLATALISAFQLAMIYLAATLIFGVRIHGSAAGLVLVGVAFCLLNAAFGLMVARQTMRRCAAGSRAEGTGSRRSEAMALCDPQA